jgi:hypothetical protein
MNPEYEPYWSNYLNQYDLSASYFQNITNSTNKYCVIVEPRIMPILPKVIKNFMYLLQNKGWGLIVVHGTKNELFIKSELSEWPNVKYYNLNVDNLTITSYNQLFCTPPFWNKLKELGCLHSFIFQTDTVLLKDDIDRFIQYDYIGAPWCIKFMGMLEVGNGGLSLRNVDKMIEITTTCQRTFTLLNGTPIHLENEDIYFAFWCLMNNYKIPTPTNAKEFSVETIYYENPSGLHKPHIDKFPSREFYIQLLNKKIV